MEIASNFSTNLPSLPFLVAATATALCFLFAIFTGRSVRFLPSIKKLKSSKLNAVCNCAHSANGTIGNSDSASTNVPYLNGCAGSMMLERAAPSVAERHTGGASMIEQLVPEITTHALSYLDYPSLCRLSMTNSSMRKAANDDDAWKALYHKDFTLEQGGMTPSNGWKAYYAATRAVVNINSEFFNIIRERSLPAMRRMWLKADYVKGCHFSGFFFSGYGAVIQSWEILFDGEEDFDLQVRDVITRVLTDMAWVTMKLYMDIETRPFNVTNVFEFHKGRWYMVHHHISRD